MQLQITIAYLRQEKLQYKLIKTLGYCLYCNYATAASGKIKNSNKNWAK